MAGVKEPRAVAFIERSPTGLESEWKFVLHWRARDWIYQCNPEPMSITVVVDRVREEIENALDEWEADLRAKWWRKR